MASPTQEAVEIFMRITGASESLALRKLEEYRGDINAAVNAHFSEGYSFDRYSAPTFPQHNYTNVNGESQGGQQQHGLFPLLSAARSFRPSSLLDPNYRRHLFNQMRRSPSFGLPSPTSQPGGMGPVPSEFNSFPPAHLSHQAQRATFEDQNHTSSSSNQERGSDIEDEMFRAAIEASKQDSSDLELLQRQQQEDDDFAHAVSLSLMMAEQEKAIHELLLDNKDQELASRTGRGEPSDSGPKECKGGTGSHHQHEQDALCSKEWGGITSKEFDESVLLEAALYGRVSEDVSENSLPASQLRNDQIQGTSKGSDLQPVPCFPISSSSTQQSHRQEETERNLAVRGASFPPEPEINDKDTVTLLLRMPDGHRHERRFFKSDKLQLLFKFIDDKVAMEPGTYRVVRPYPRCAFGVEDGSMMLRDLGLTGKQEALFVELI